MIMMRKAVVAGIYMILMSCPALCSEKTQLDHTAVIAIQRTVKMQLDAFKEGDAAGAFSLTTTAARVRFANAEEFLSFIKSQYQPIYQYRLALFSNAEVVGGNVIQLVRVTDADNHVWLAVYLMQQDDEKDWKIDGCQLLETTSVSI